MHSNGIENVAIYLRKSRDNEDEDVLGSHRLKLVEHAESMGWDYKIYEEGVKSGDSLATRPKMNKLLADVERGLFDGVLIMDYDRLSRGNKYEQGLIENTLKSNETKIITPQKVYDLDNDIDDMLVGVQALLAKEEFKMIKKRMIQGKQSRAKQGKWVNGKPPFPYYYEREARSVKVDETKRGIYRLILDKYLYDKTGTQEIAVWLNNNGIPSPMNTVWHNNAVKRLLVHEFHLGKIAYGKEKWVKTTDGKRSVKGARDRSEWFVGEGDHETLKTEEEHEKILRILTTNNKVPKKSRAGCFPTTGLMFCKKCGYTMKYSVDNKPNKKTGKVYNYTKCYHIDPYGNKCSQRGIKMDEDFYKALYDMIIGSYLNTDHSSQIQSDGGEKQVLQTLLSSKQNDLEAAEKALLKATEAFEAGVNSLSDFAERKKVNEAKINQLKREIVDIESQLEGMMRYSEDEIQQLMNEFKDNWQQATTSKEQNQLLKSLVNRIWYDREGDTITFEIEYK